MDKTVLIRRVGQQIELSADGVAPLQDEVISFLAPKLKYESVEFLTGYAALKAKGSFEEQYHTEEKLMYYFDEGRMITMRGYIPRVLQELQARGYTARYHDFSPPASHTEAYIPNWENVYRVFGPYNPEVGIVPGTFRPRQEEALRALASKQFGIIDACTGFGKTHIFTSAVLLYPRAKIDIVVKPVEVAGRLYRQLLRHISSVGMVGGGSKTTGRVTIYTADSLHYSDRTADFVFADECHQLVADSHFQELGRYDRARIFGFTATSSGRKGGTDERIEALFGPIIFKLTYPEAQALGLVVPMRVTWLRVPQMPDIPSRPAKAIDREKQLIWRNPVRNRIIADHARMRDPEDQVLIMCRTLEHGVLLQQLLPDFELCYAGVSNERLSQMRFQGTIPDDFTPISAARREQLRAAFEAGTLKRAIATDIWATGVDFERLSILYRADARDSRILDVQLPGRSARISSNKAYGEVVDCYDSFDKTLFKRARERRKAYADLGFTQEWPGG